jgi:hypothetical protein
VLEELLKFDKNIVTSSRSAEAKFVVPDWGDKVDSGKGLKSTLVKG